MATVPLRCVQLHRTLTGSNEPVDPDALVQLGRCVEVDLDALTPGESAAVLAMWSDTRRMWNAVRNTVTPTGGWVRTRSTLHHGRQDTGRAKVDLHEELGGLGELGAAGEVISMLLSSKLDHDALAEAAAPWAGTVAVDGASTTLTLTFTRPHHWPGTLGPGVTPTEASRTLTICARHASWRDRAVRRLVEVTVEIDELWADPRAVAA